MLTNKFGELKIEDEDETPSDLPDINHNKEHMNPFAKDIIKKEIETLNKNEASLVNENNSCEDMPRLQKASSVPALHSQKRIKTSDAGPVLDPIMLGNLMQENQLLKENLLKLKDKNLEIISINHDWDVSYNNLLQQHRELEKQFQMTCENLKNELLKRDEEKERLKTKLEQFINEGSLDEKTLLIEEKEEKSKILQREQAALQTVKEYQMKFQQFQHVIRQSNEQKNHMERELQRLTMCLENQQQPQKNFAGARDSPTNLQHPNFDKSNEVELLQQQLQMYVEDFDAEKNEKKRILKENEEIKQRLTVIRDDNEHLRRQLQLYERDFSREREKRIQLMRKSNHMSRSGFERHEDWSQGEQDVNGMQSMLPPYPGR